VALSVGVLVRLGQRHQAIARGVRRAAQPGDQVVREERTGDLARLQRDLVGGARRQQRLAGARELVGHPDLEPGAGLAALGREQRTALAAVDQRDPDVGAQRRQMAAELGEREPVAAELERLAVGVPGEVEQHDDAIGRIAPQPGDLALDLGEGLGQRGERLALQHEQVARCHTAELAEHLREPGGVGLGEVQRDVVGVARVVADDHGDPPGARVRGGGGGDDQDEGEQRAHHRTALSNTSDSSARTGSASVRVPRIAATPPAATSRSRDRTASAAIGRSDSRA
jgi:hypothetical protein